jgi:hypothetical protein
LLQPKADGFRVPRGQQQTIVTMFRTDPVTSATLKRMSAASGLSQNQILNAIVRNALRNPKTLGAAMSFELATEFHQTLGVR